MLLVYLGSRHHHCLINLHSSPFMNHPFLEVLAYFFSIRYISKHVEEQPLSGKNVSHKIVAAYQASNNRFFFKARYPRTPSQSSPLLQERCHFFRKCWSRSCSPPLYDPHVYGNKIRWFRDLSEGSQTSMIVMSQTKRNDIGAQEACIQVVRWRNQAACFPCFHRHFAWNTSEIFELSSTSFTRADAGFSSPRPTSLAWRSSCAPLSVRPSSRTGKKGRVCLGTVKCSSCSEPELIRS